MIPFKNRFHGHGSLNFVYRNGQAVRCRLATIKYVKNPKRSEPRFAVVIGKKVVKSAVRRNRIRRRTYEYLQKKIGLPGGVFDIVVIITSAELLATTHQELTDILDQLFDQAKLN